MTESEYKTLKEWAEANPKALLEVVDRLAGDGHAIWKVDAFPQVPTHLLPIQTLHSDRSDYKSTIFDHETGEAVDKMEGIYGLQLSGRLVSALGLDVPGFGGRGSQCRADCAALREYAEARVAELAAAT